MEGFGMLIQNHCPPWPIVTVSVLEYRPEVRKNLEKKYPERDQCWVVPLRGQQSPMGQKGHKDSLYTCEG